MTDRQLSQLMERTFAGDCTALVRQLARQLIIERQCNKAVIENLCRQRNRVIELEKKFKPGGRVLIVDAPGDLIVYRDQLIDFCMVTIETAWNSDDFDAVLESELMREQKRFQQMPWELSSRYETAWRRKHT